MKFFAKNGAEGPLGTLLFFAIFKRQACVKHLTAVKNIFFRTEDMNIES